MRKSAGAHIIRKPSPFFNHILIDKNINVDSYLFFYQFFYKFGPGMSTGFRFELLTLVYSYFVHVLEGSGT